MALETEREIREAACALLEARRAEAADRLDAIHDAVRNKVNDIYVPAKATQEYRRLVDQSRFNVLPLVITAIAQALYVDGYRPSSGGDSAVWDAVWQPNRMDARQAGLFRAAVQYGVSYARVLPGVPAPVITPLSPRRCTALYEDPTADEWPELALVHLGGRRFVMYDDVMSYPITDPEEGEPKLTAGEGAGKHGLGVCPVVRFVDSYEDLDDGPCGKVEPLLPVQRQLNQTTYSLLMAQQYAAFRQRWVAGMTIEEDAQGRPIEPFDVGVDRMLHAEDADARFGEFGQTDLGGYLDSRDKALLYIASTAQIPPHNLVVGNAVSNISAEALAALEAGHRQDVAEHQTSFGESVEQMLRLAGRAMGDMEAWEDTSAEVVWRDTTPRSLAQVADALGKLATQLDIPPRELWSRIPGVTQTEIERWAGAADSRDGLADMAALLATPAPGTDGEMEVDGGERAGAGVDAVPSAAGVAAR
ncbi:phage portal protein [Streptomyces sp. SBT349]|uniref:phage portal protein n=1 Tax=Streptomyces sp. SBT349 TaxID=1580539 RepID=UPI00066B4B62|nr:phage portal protein [Streptomyces sp. SBT349]